MNLYQANICRVSSGPERMLYKRVLLQAPTAQAAGRSLKRAFPLWEKLHFWRVTDKVIVL